MVTKALIHCDRATYFKNKSRQGHFNLYLGYPHDTAVCKNDCKSSYWFDSECFLLVFYPIQPRKFRIYVVINHNSSWNMDDQPLVLPILESPLKVLAYPQNWLIMWVLEVMGEYCTLVNRKCYLWTGVSCNIHQHSNNWCIFPQVLVMWRIYHLICFQRSLYRSQCIIKITIIHTTIIKNVFY